MGADDSPGQPSKPRPSPRAPPIAGRFMNDEAGALPCSQASQAAIEIISGRCVPEEWSEEIKRFIAAVEGDLCVVAVPKNSKELTLAMSASAHWSGGFIGGDGFENTDKSLITMPLH